MVDLTGKNHARRRQVECRVFLVVGGRFSDRHDEAAAHGKRPRRAARGSRQGSKDRQPGGGVALRNAVQRLLDEGKGKILLNFAGVNYLDSNGIGTLISSHQAVNERASKNS